MNERGLLNKAEERWLARFLERLIKFDNRAIEAADYFVFLALVRVADNQLIDRLPDKWLNPFRRLIELSRKLDLEGIGQLVKSNYALSFPMPLQVSPIQERLVRHAYGILEVKIYEGLLNIKMRGMTRRQIRKLERSKKSL